MRLYCVWHALQGNRVAGAREIYRRPKGRVAQNYRAGARISHHSGGGV